MDVEPVEMMPKHMYVRTEDIVSGNLWQRFPVINVDKVADIPCDYPGAMGVPITFIDKFSPEQFELLGVRGHLKLPNGREPYQRIIIRHRKPKLPEVVDLVELLAQCGVAVSVVDVSKVKDRPGDYVPHFRARIRTERMKRDE